MLQILSNISKLFIIGDNPPSQQGPNAFPLLNPPQNFFTNLSGLFPVNPIIASDSPKKDINLSRTNAENINNQERDGQHPKEKQTINDEVVLDENTTTTKVRFLTGGGVLDENLTTKKVSFSAVRDAPSIAGNPTIRVATPTKPSSQYFIQPIRFSIRSGNSYLEFEMKAYDKNGKLLNDRNTKKEDVGFFKTELFSSTGNNRVKMGELYSDVNSRGIIYEQKSAPSSYCNVGSPITKDDYINQNRYLPNSLLNKRWTGFAQSTILPGDIEKQIKKMQKEMFERQAVISSQRQPTPQTPDSEHLSTKSGIVSKMVKKYEMEEKEKQRQTEIERQRKTKEDKEDKEIKLKRILATQEMQRLNIKSQQRAFEKESSRQRVLEAQIQEESYYEGRQNKDNEEAALESLKTRISQQVLSQTEKELTKLCKSKGMDSDAAQRRGALYAQSLKEAGAFKDRENRIFNEKFHTIFNHNGNSNRGR